MVFRKELEKLKLLPPRLPRRRREFTYIFSVTAVDSQLEPSAVLNHATKVKFEVGLELV